MRYSIKTITLIGVLSVQALLAQTAQPTTFTAQGVLRDAQGRSLADDTYEMIFQIYGNINGTGNAIWSETAQVDVVNGVWAYTLGSDNANLLDDLDVDGTNYLKITVGGDALSPLTQISLRPYELLNVSGGGNVVPTTGNVGIGTNNPNFKLDVQPISEATARIGRAEIGTWPAGESFAYFGNQNLNHSNAGDYAILQQTNGTTFLNSRSGQKMHFRISNTDKMVMLSNGNIGINSTNPSEKLDVVGNIELNGYLEMQPWSSGPKLADTFGGNTSKSIINFTKMSGSTDPGAIIHETRGSGGETNEGVLHLMPSDDNAYGDYVSIHGTDDADMIKLHTDGTVEGVGEIRMSGYVKGGSGSIVRKRFYSSGATTAPKYPTNNWTDTYTFSIPKVWSDSHVFVEVQYSYRFGGSGADTWYGSLFDGYQRSKVASAHHGRAFNSLSPHLHKFTTNTSTLSLKVQHTSNGGTASSGTGYPNLGNSDDAIYFHSISVIATEVRP